ncbi:unnamed protein product (macronuclear) [Paramecium tetraurelia]|uniref:Chromosome undetermined scaffold_165, whole genome shotgun sequence n=1 Tax=Paramecium tetraurelia TaxID=5888 RepID=Q3SED7_PARTE|nr:uncharacterized protein GSPATT00037028001 [Paramecium tetraurelia]CAI38987.1 VAMP-associated protein 3-1 [Paramecium tetraurelia]CAK68245.1 unnamed protein product [Paramecium tetraurelia]|eukprot:XP_001435642.1 hypothetical protein (macronuclear) [Paramecium tetraurelia strain d4-2]
MQGIIETDPKIILEFMAEENRFAHAQLTLQNLQSQPVAFKIKTTVPQMFQVKPSVGFIEADRSTIVEISTTQAIGQDQKLDAKFQINACFRDSNEQDLNQFWRSRDQSTIQTFQLRSRMKYQNPQDQQNQQQQQQQQQQQITGDSKILESSIFNSSHSESRMFKSIKEDSQKDELLNQYKDQYEKLSQEYQVFKQKIQQDQFNNLSKKESNAINTRQALIVVIIALVIGYILGK